MERVPTDSDSEQDHEAGLLVRLRALGADVEQLRDTEVWRQWLTTSAKFHTYSFGNQLLIAFQDPGATRVAGYRKWQELGRQVRKGEKGIRICAPIVRKVEGESKIVAFKVVSVFDVAQTEGDPLPEHPPWPMANGDADTLLYNLVRATGDAGLTVLFPPADEGLLTARGWYEPGEQTISIRDSLYKTDGLVEVITDVPTAQQAKTLLHELGHHFDTDLAYADRDTKEIVAESVAWLCATQLGLEVDEGATSYLASWGADTAGILAAGRRIVAAVKSIESLLTAASKEQVA